MKPINFTPALSAEQYRAVRTWFIISATAASCIGITTTFITIHRWYQLHTQKKQLAALQVKTKTFESAMQEKQKLTQEKQLLTQQLALVNPPASNEKNPLALVQTITTAAGAIITINSLNIFKHTLEISGLCKTTQEALTFAHALGQSPLLASSLLTSIRPEISGTASTMRFTLKATRTKKPHTK